MPRTWPPSSAGNRHLLTRRNMIWRCKRHCCVPVSCPYRDSFPPLYPILGAGRMLRSVTLALSLLIALPAVIHAQTPPPNIVFCFADDWGRYASCYAGLDNRPTVNDVIKTPNIDAVAKRGAIFRNAF